MLFVEPGCCDPVSLFLVKTQYGLSFHWMVAEHRDCDGASCDSASGGLMKTHPLHP